MFYVLQLKRKTQQGCTNLGHQVWTTKFCYIQSEHNK